MKQLIKPKTKFPERSENHSNQQQIINPKNHRKQSPMNLQPEILSKQTSQTTEPTQLSSQQPEYLQYRYRWVIVAIVAYSMIINGLANNNVIPIASKLSKVYGLSTVFVSAPITVSFLVYSLMNFPANHIIDKKGLRVSFLIGIGLYSAGMLTAMLVNTSYVFVILGAILFALGQPFVINCPAKVAAYWFSSSNRPFATAIMTAFNLIGTGIGFVTPTLFVHEDSLGDMAKGQILALYGMEAGLAVVCLLAVFIFMKAKPPTLPSIAAEQEKTDLKQSFKIIRADRNLWVFMSAYIVVYGTLLSFGSQANLLFKPYDFQDIQIALMAIALLAFGVIGSIGFSLYIKRTQNYRLCIRMIPILAIVFMSITCIVLNTNPTLGLMFVCTALIGLSFTPLVPICYDLGCELAFPIGEAQVIGILNGGSMIYTFIFILILNSAVGLKTKTDSLILMIVFTVILGIGAVLFWFVKVILKRRMVENGQLDIEGLTKKGGVQIEIQKISEESPTRIINDGDLFTGNGEEIQKKYLIQKGNYEQFVDDAL